jgi:hypothetical protein
MVPITIVNGVYKPSYNWGAPPCRSSENIKLFLEFSDKLVTKYQTVHQKFTVNIDFDISRSTCFGV